MRASIVGEVVLARFLVTLLVKGAMGDNWSPMASASLCFHRALLSWRVWRRQLLIRSPIDRQIALEKAWAKQVITGS